MNGDRADGFLSRWARRKEQARAGEVLTTEASVPVPAPPAPALVPVVEVAEARVASTENAAEVPTEPLPTMADVALLTSESDFSRFVSPGVDDAVKRAAMKKLFADPHFNIMDGLDTYIDDYGKPDPIPLAMLRQMNQAKFLRLFDDDDDEAEAANPPGLASGALLTVPRTESRIEPPTDPTIDPTSDPKPSPNDDPDLRLQQDDADRRPGPDQGLGA